MNAKHVKIPQVTAKTGGAHRTPMDLAACRWPAQRWAHLAPERRRRKAWRQPQTQHRGQSDGQYRRARLFKPRRRQSTKSAMPARLGHSAIFAFSLMARWDINGAGQLLCAGIGADLNGDMLRCGAGHVACRHNRAHHQRQRHQYGGKPHVFAEKGAQRGHWPKRLALGRTKVTCTLCPPCPLAF